MFYSTAKFIDKEFPPNDDSIYGDTGKHPKKVLNIILIIVVIFIIINIRM